MDMTMWVIAFALGVLSLLGWLLRSLNEWRYCHSLILKNGITIPPGHMGWPIIGELFDFLWCFKIIRNPEEFIRKRKAKYGDTGIYRTHLFGFPSIITCSPEVNKFVMGCGTEDGSFVTGWPCPELVGPKSLIIAERHQHKRVRRYLMEAINSPESLKIIFTQLQPAFKSALDDWASKGIISAFQEVRRVTFGNISMLFLSRESSPIFNTMEMLYSGLTAGLRAQTTNVPGTAYYHALQCRKKLSTILLSEIRERKVNKVVRTDFLQKLMDSVDDSGDTLNEEEVLDNIVSLVLGGYESTSKVLMWSLYYLSKYPNVLQKLREENDFIRKQKAHDELLLYDDVKMMTYTCKVADEIIRLANVAAFMFRTVAKDVEFNGYTFPKGWKVLIWVRSLHVDPHYFQDPLKFNPDRWNGFKPRPGVYQAFGYGPRLCPGNNFATLQLIIFLHYVCIYYKWELLNPNARMTFLPHPTPADGAKMVFSHV
eukprot:Gb_31473 [translate_table: standard]